MRGSCVGRRVRRGRGRGFGKLRWLVGTFSRVRSSQYGRTLGLSVVSVVVFCRGCTLWSVGVVCRGALSSVCRGVVVSVVVYSVVGRIEM